VYRRLGATKEAGLHVNVCASDGELLSLVSNLTLTHSTDTGDYRFYPYCHPGPSDISFVYRPSLAVNRYIILFDSYC
jgi:hypothetical protein